MQKFHSQMTREQVFEAYTEEAKSGRFPCVTLKGQCRYRVEDRGCAIGVFLPDGLARTLDFGIGAISNWENYTLCKEHLPPWMTKDLATQLQDTHDELGIDQNHGRDDRVGVYINKIKNILLPTS